MYHLLFEVRPINYLFRNRWCLTQRKGQRKSNGQSGIDNLERHWAHMTQNETNKAKSTNQLTWYRATRTQRKIRGFRRVSSSCMIFSNTLLLRNGLVECTHTHTIQENWWCGFVQNNHFILFGYEKTGNTPLKKTCFKIEKSLSLSLSLSLSHHHHLCLPFTSTWVKGRFFGGVPFAHLF
jgi:hypothetical protein